MNRQLALGIDSRHRQPTKDNRLKCASTSSYQQEEETDQESSSGSFSQMVEKVEDVGRGEELRHQHQ